MLIDATTHRFYTACQTYTPALDEVLSLSASGNSIVSHYTVRDCVNSTYKVEICYERPTEFCKEAIDGEPFLAFVHEIFFPETLHITKLIVKPVNHLYGPEGTEIPVGKDYHFPRT